MKHGLRWSVLVACGLLWAGAAAADETVGLEMGDPGLTVDSGGDFSSEDVSGAMDSEVEPVHVSMDFEDATLTTVLKSFSQQTGINVIAVEGVGERPVTLFLEDVSVLDAFDQILNAGELTYERAEGSDIYIVRPASEEDAVATITRIYRIRYARVSKSILAKTAASLITGTPFEAASLTSSGTAGTAGEEVGIDLLVQELLTDHGKAVVDPRTNSLMVTDVPENFARIEAVLATLDIRTPQILVDAEVIETSIAKLKDLGFEWGTGQEGDMFTFVPGAGRQTRFPLGSLGDGYAPTSGPSLFGTNTISFASFTGVLQALESDTDSKVLARPKVLTLDNEAAIIRLTSDETIGFDVTTDADTGVTTVEPLRTTTGVILAVTPQINDGGYITMIVEPSVTKTVPSKLEPPSGAGDVRDPKTRKSRTIVRIRNGDTLVVGGLIDRSDEHSERRVPILAGIPFMGEAFKNKEINDNVTELIVFVTPRIISEAPESQVATAAPSPWGGAQSSPEPLGTREQERTGVRQDSIEETLNRLGDFPE